MVNMYGAGNAYNLRFQQPSLHRPIAPNRARAMQGPVVQHCHGHNQGPTNITINNGPQGPLGIALGFLQGLGLLGGGFNQVPMSTFGMLNQAALVNGNQSGTNELANLKAMYSKYSVLDNGNGTYTLTTGNGDNVKTGTYDELMQGIKPTTETTETETTETETTETETTETETTETETTDTTTTTTTTSTASDTTTTGGSATPGTAAKADELKGYNGKFSVSDKARGTGDIVRNSCIISSDKSPDGFPKQITVGGYIYNYARTENGTAIYESKSASAAGDEYRLEKNADGTFGLNQYKGMKGAGTADITQASKAKTEKSLGVDNMAGEKPWSAEQKAEYNKPLEVQFALHTAGWGTDGGTAIVKMPDGSVITAQIGDTWTDKGAVEEISEKLLDQIHAAGWTGVTTITNNSKAMKEATGTGEDETYSFTKQYSGSVNVDKSEVKIGKDGGEVVAEALGGYTFDSDKKEAIDTINAQNPSSIKSFLKGYNSESEIGKQDIMQQISTENGWAPAEKKSCYQKIIANLLAASKGQEGTEAYKGLKDIYENLLQNKIQTLTEDQAKACDKWINDLTGATQAKQERDATLGQATATVVQHKY